ncbi:MAG: hypothetical protein JO024_03105 [Candidatus Eremiobacteraeota bacterium]|nr:hypothetical protein [Candidatus Eremiobacteraeota bacterium]MBV9737805.1 hypothetical protein [Candidatus Eremiobacteraeota bacterium]
MPRKSTRRKAGGRKRAGGAKKTVRRTASGAKKAARSATKVVSKTAKRATRAVKKAGKKVKATTSRARDVGRAMATAGVIIQESADVIDSMADRAAKRTRESKKRPQR